MEARGAGRDRGDALLADGNVSMGEVDDALGQGIASEDLGSVVDRSMEEISLDVDRNTDMQHAYSRGLKAVNKGGWLLAT